MAEPLQDLLAERLFLRTPNPQHIPQMLDHLKDWETVRYTASFPYPFLPLDAARRIDGMLKAIGEGSVIYSIIRKSDLQWMGFCGLSTIADGAADMGFIMGRRFWGQGFMREAVRVLLTENFRHCWFNSVIAETYLQNRRSQNVMMSLGFKKEPGIILCRSSARGGEFPGIRFSLNSQDWPG